MSVNPLKQLYNDFITIINSIVIKYRSEAEDNETADSKKLGDQYVNACLQRDSFDSYYKYDKSIIASVMSLTNEAQIYAYSENKNSIPLRYRDEIFKKQHELIVGYKDDSRKERNYIEYNNYYRCLEGTPDIGETEKDFFYVDDETAKIYGIDKNVPVHKLEEPYISILSSIKYIDKLIRENPEKKYLNYLGTNKIDVVSARTASNFGLLRVSSTISESLLNSFLLIYEQCRQYFMSCIYVYEYKQTIPYYDNFIALCIMIMTMQQVISRVLRNNIDRDFFDSYCIKLLFDSYGVPFNESMDSATQSQLVQNLNLLILNKGTNKVIFDIASILGYERLEIYKYYLMKVQKFDKEGFPIEVYKTDETGNQVLDYPKMFDIYFQKISIKQQDVYDIISDNNNRVSYSDIVTDDPYWVDDDKLNKELYESEYNYVESKYMSVGISYRMSKILFENIYFLRMILDKKDEIPGIILDIPKISLYTKITLFDAVVILSAIMCKQNNLKGEILTDLSKILHVLEFNYTSDGRIISADAATVTLEDVDMHVMGFNFEKSFKEIQDNIKEDPYLNRPVKNPDGTKERYTYADELCNFFKDPTTISVEGVNRLYNNFKDLYDFLNERMSTATDINLYRAYKKLYKGIFYTKESRKMFNMGTDEKPIYANTYMEYVKKMIPEVALFIENTEKNNLYDITRYIISRITSLFPELKHLGFFDGHSNTMEEMLIQYINFFKSYTTDLVSLNILYVFDLKPDSILKLIDHVKISSNLWTKENFKIAYSDNLDFTSTIYKKDVLEFYDKMIINSVLSIFDSKKFIDDIYGLYDTNILIDKSINYYDAINFLYNRSLLYSKLVYEELISIYNKFDLKSYISFKDYFRVINERIIIEKNYIIDNSYLYINFLLSLKFVFNDIMNIYCIINRKSNIKFADFLSLFISEKIYNNFILNDNEKINKSISLDDIDTLNDNINDISNHYLFNNDSKYNEIISYINKCQIYNGDISLFDNNIFNNNIITKNDMSYRDNCKIFYN